MKVFLYLIDKPGEVYDDERQRYVKKGNTNSEWAENPGTRALAKVAEICKFGEWDNMFGN
jgi:hypothetical protein